MHKPLKDGAFVMAVQQQVPIVPVTFVNNYKIMFDSNPSLTRMPLLVVVHEPISTIGKTQEDIEALKEEVFQVIQSTLLAYNS